jgi:hypothetical protein
MTTPTRIERLLPDILADLSAAPTPEYLDDVFVRTGRLRQRPAWTFPERWLPMDIATRAAPAARLPWRQLGILALIAVLLAVALAAYVGSQRHVPPPFGPARNGLIPYASNGDIYLGDPATGQTSVVVAGAENDWGPSYSYDGTWIGFIRDTSATAFDIYVVRPDGRELRRLTSAPISNDSWAQWAPDSRHLAVIHPVDGTGCASTDCGVNQLDLIDASDGSVQTVAQADRMDYVEFRPPDGRELLYRALVDGKWGLFAMDADGKNVRAVVPPTVPAQMDATFGTATYSPDGSRIFFNQYTLDASAGEPGCCQLFVVDADGTGLHKFVPNTGAGTWDGDPAVSPDGNLVAFWHNLPDQATQRVTVVRADGTGEPIETGPELANGAHWIWAPDSSAILMYPNGVESGRAYLLDPAGGQWTFLPWTSTGDLDWQRLAP